VFQFLFHACRLILDPVLLNRGTHVALNLEYQEPRRLHVPFVRLVRVWSPRALLIGQRNPHALFLFPKRDFQLIAVFANEELSFDSFFDPTALKLYRLEQCTQDAVPVIIVLGERTWIAESSHRSPLGE